MRHFYNGVPAGMVGQVLEKVRNHVAGYSVIVKFYNAPFQKRDQQFCKGKYFGLLDEISDEEFAAALQTERLTL